MDAQIRLLPVVCTGEKQCASARTLKEELTTALKDSKSTAYRVLKALEVAIADNRPFLCADKKCGTGELCIEGRCVNMDDLESSTAATEVAGANGQAVKATPIQRLRYDNIVTSSAPLALIAGVPADKDPLSFQQAVKQNSEADKVLGPKDASTSTTTKYLAFAVGGIAIAGLVWFFAS